MSILALAEAAPAITTSLDVFDFSWVSSPQGWVALLTLCVLEIVLGIDNLVFISILVEKLPPDRRPKARFFGLALAMLTRIMLLLTISWVMSLTKPLFTLPLPFNLEISGKDLVLIVGGLFLIYKSTKEIHEKVEDGGHADLTAGAARAAFGAVLVQIAVLDIVFSLDSVITAVGMVEYVSLMVIAVLIAVGFMMVFAGTVSDFVSRHPTVKILALSFLLLIGTTLIGEGLHFHIPKGYVYFAMGFSVFVEMLNLRSSKKKKEASAPEGV
jgi:predicted tellurium resistance membrane protein TerC